VSYPPDVPLDYDELDRLVRAALHAHGPSRSSANPLPAQSPFASQRIRRRVLKAWFSASPLPAIHIPTLRGRARSRLSALEIFAKLAARASDVGITVAVEGVASTGARHGECLCGLCAASGMRSASMSMDRICCSRPILKNARRSCIILFGKRQQPTDEAASIDDAVDSSRVKYVCDS
jgi:hypothetical protein